MTPAARSPAVFRSACAVFALASALAPGAASLPAGSRGAGWIGLHLALSAACALAVWSHPGDRRSLVWLLGAGLASRGFALATPAFLSNDLYRYLWDGHLLLSGADPWTSSPGQFPDSPWPLPPDNQSIASLYPPLAMGSFALAALAGPVGGVWMWRALTTLASLALMGVAARDSAGTPREKWLPLVVLSPLLVMESGVGAHLDALSSLAVVLAISAHQRGGPLRTGLWLGLGALIKLLPLVLLVPIAFCVGRRALVRTVAAAVGVVAIGYGVTFAAGLAPIGSLPIFLRTWRFGAPVYLLEQLLGTPATRAASLLVLGAMLLWTIQRARAGGLLHAVGPALGAPLLVSPVVHPWYLLPLAATAGLSPTGFALAWITTAPLTYEVIDRYQTTGQWSPASWPVVVIAAALLLGLIFDRMTLPARGGNVKPMQVLGASQVGGTGTGGQAGRVP